MLKNKSAFLRGAFAVGCAFCLASCFLLEDDFGANQPPFKIEPPKANTGPVKLDPYHMPPDCNLVKVYVFKVVCDPASNIFGIDRSFVEAVCGSEMKVLETMKQEDAYGFLKQRLDYFSGHWSKIKEASTSPYVNLMSNAKITALIDTGTTQSVTCSLNGGDDFIEVRADVSPICRNNNGIFDNEKCGVAVNNLKITNNNYIISHIKLDREGTMDPALAYRFTSGFIYQGFFPSGKKSSGYYSEDPTEGSFYMTKDTKAFLDRYR